MSLRDSPISPKVFKFGTHRAITPDETLRFLTPLLWTVGITRVANITGLDRIGLPVACAIRPNSKSLSVSLGKGMTEDAAQVAAIMESLELYHGENIDLPTRHASLAELQDAVPVVRPSDLPHCRNSRFTKDLKILWIEAQVIDSKDTVWIPFECVHTDASLPEPEGSGCFNSTSNGLAAGNNSLEAISHALCEVVERDATTLLHLTSLEEQRSRRICLDTIDDPLCLSLLDRFRRAGLGTMIWDATSDVHIPSFTCTLLELDQGDTLAFYTSNGAGCHPNKAIAMARALTEAAQSRLTLISGSRDDLTRTMYVNRPDVRRIFSFLTEEFYKKGMRSFQDVTSQENSNIDEDVFWIVKRLRDVGIEQILSVNLTKREIGIPVIRVIVPGLETSDEIADYSPGRRAAKHLGEQ